MKLSIFVEKFVDGFENHIEDLANGSGSKLMNLRDTYQELAISYYDQIVDSGEMVTETDLENCIEIEKEKAGI